MDTVTIPLDLFERLMTGAKCLAEGRRLNDKQREAWKAIIIEAKTAQMPTQPKQDSEIDKTLGYLWTQED